MQPRAAAGTADDALHEPGELSGRRDRRPCPHADDGAGNRPGRAFLSPFAQDAPKFDFWLGVHDVGRGTAARRIHPHVQRPVVLETETAGRVFDLRRRKPEVEQDAVRARPAGLAQGRRGSAEVGLDDLHPRIERSEAGAAGGYRVRVTVEPEQPSLPRRKQRRGVSPAADRPVEQVAVETRREQRHRFFAHDRTMGCRGHGRQRRRWG